MNHSKKNILILVITLLVSFGLMTSCIAAIANNGSNHPSRPATTVTKTKTAYSSPSATTETSVPDPVIPSEDTGSVNIDPNINPDGHIDLPNIHRPGHHHHF